MDAEELKKRLWYARVDMERETGRALQPTALVLNDVDWAAVKASASAHMWASLGANTFLGIPVQVDPRRTRGTVALAWIKEV